MSDKKDVEVVAETAAVASAEASWSQSRAVLRVIVLILVVAASLWLLYELQSVILLVVLSIFFAYLIAPLVEFVSRPIFFPANFKSRLWTDARQHPPHYSTIKRLAEGLSGVCHS